MRQNEVFYQIKCVVQHILKVNFEKQTILSWAELISEIVKFSKPK